MCWRQIVVCGSFKCVGEGAPRYQRSMLCLLIPFKTVLTGCLRLCRISQEMARPEPPEQPRATNSFWIHTICSEWRTIMNQWWNRSLVPGVTSPCVIGNTTNYWTNYWRPFGCRLSGKAVTVLLKWAEALTASTHCCTSTVMVLFSLMTMIFLFLLWMCS